MPMDAAILANSIITALGLPPTDTAARAAWTTIAQQIITHIQTNGTITVAGVQPGTGTATGTIL